MHPDRGIVYNKRQYIYKTIWHEHHQLPTRLHERCPQGPPLWTRYNPSFPVFLVAKEATFQHPMFIYF